MPDKYSHKKKPATHDANWTADGLDIAETPPVSVLFSVDERGVKITKDGIIFLDMSYGEIAGLVDKIDAMEAEIGRLWAALQGKLEVETD